PRQPLTSTLFPYTTLFRSPTLVVQRGQPVLALGGSGGPTIATNVTQLTLAALVFGQEPAEAVAAPRIYIPTRGKTLLVEEGTTADRKSTRLNSSHVKISYA